MKVERCPDDKWCQENMPRLAILGVRPLVPGEHAQVSNIERSDHWCQENMHRLAILGVRQLIQESMPRLAAILGVRQLIQESMPRLAAIFKL